MKWDVKVALTVSVLLRTVFLNAEINWIDHNQQMIQCVKSGQSRKAVETGSVLVNDIRNEFLKTKKVSADEIVFLVNQGIICKQIREYQSAREALELAIECKSRIASPNDPLFVTIYKALGETFQELKDFEQGEKYFLKALRIKEVNMGGDHVELIPLYLSIADFYQKAEKNKEALICFEKALKISSMKDKSDEKTAKINFKIGEFFYKQKEYGKAEQSFLIAFNIYNINKDYEKIASIYDYLGTLKMINGDLKEAESSYKLSMKNKELSSGKNSIDYAKSLNNLGKVYTMQNRQEAEDLLNESLGIRERILGKNHPSLVIVLSNLMDFYIKNSNPAEAEKIKKRLSQIQKKK